jgi:hypothetical protein
VVCTVPVPIDVHMELVMRWDAVGADPKRHIRGTR